MLVAAVILVGAVAGLDLVLTFAILRRLRTMQTRPVSSDEGAIPLPSTGYIVPEFSIVDDLGTAVTRADLAEGHRTVVMLSPTCPPCKDMVATLEADRTGDALVFVMATVEESAEMTARLRAYRTIHITEDWAEQVFQVAGYPAVLSLMDGVVTSAGHKLPAMAA